MLPPGEKIEFEDDDSFWVPLKGLNEKNKDVIENHGYVRISVTILPKELYYSFPSIMYLL